jgi:glycine cleavage system H protein
VSQIPDHLRYTAEHEWVAGPDDDGVVTFGITDFAQDALGDIVYVSLPADGAELVAGQPCGEIESTKSVSELYAPVSGVVTERNDRLDATPETLNSDPYGDGWMVRLRPADPDAVAGLLDASAYGSVARA